LPMILSDPQSHFKMNTRYQKVVTKFRIQQQYKRAHDRRRMPRFRTDTTVA